MHRIIERKNQYSITTTILITRWIRVTWSHMNALWSFIWWVLWQKQIYNWQVSNTMANKLFALDGKMHIEREVKKLRHVMRLHKSFKSQKNSDINPSRNVLRWDRKGINDRIGQDMCLFQKRFYHLLLVANSWTFFPFFNRPFFLQCRLMDFFPELSMN